MYIDQETKIQNHKVQTTTQSKLPIEWVGGKLEVRIPYSKKLNLAWLRAF